MEKLSLKILYESLDYNENTGMFVRKKSNKSSIVGKEAGRLHKKRGYREISVNGKLYYAHRLAWFYKYGKFPSLPLDHIDRDKSNNSISNLRAVTVSENGQNRYTPQKNNKLGVFGVKRNGSGYSSRIKVGDKAIHLGTFRTIKEAEIAYLIAKKKYHIKSEV